MSTRYKTLTITLEGDGVRSEDFEALKQTLLNIRGISTVEPGLVADITTHVAYGDARMTLEALLFKVLRAARNTSDARDIEVYLKEKR